MARPGILVWIVVAGLVGWLLAGCEAAPLPSGPGGSSGPGPGATATLPVALPCEDLGGPLLLPSNRFIGVRHRAQGAVDRLEFLYGAPAPGPAVNGQGFLTVPEPPFTMAGSGEPFQVRGMRHAQFVMTGMVLFDEDGVATYDGPQQIEPGLPAIRELRLFDAFEGHAGWIVGYDGPGCLVPLERDEAGVLAFEVPHPPG